MARKHKVDEVLFSLRRKHDVKVSGRTIYLLNGKNKKFPKQNDLGNGSHGKIDFLVNHCNFESHYVEEYPKGI